MASRDGLSRWSLAMVSRDGRGPYRHSNRHIAVRVTLNHQDRAVPSNLLRPKRYHGDRAS
jgi:hypothetical protein